MMRLTRRRTRALSNFIVFRCVSTIRKIGLKEESSSSKLPIGIVGCGLGGAALARALHLRDIPFVVFEKDTSFSSRSQGYALTIQQGIQAFDDLGLKVDMVEGSLSLIEKEVSKVLFCTSHSHVSLSRMGEVIGAYGPPHSPKSSQEEANIRNKRKKEKKNFHIPRQFLRELLLRGFDNSRIKWGHNLQGYECIDQSNENSGLLLHFHGQCSFPVKGLVACDGIYSSVRQLKEYYAKRRSYDDETKLLRPDKELNFLGLFVILGMTKGDVGCRCCTVSTDSSGYLRRKVQWVDGSTRVFSMPYDRHRVMWQLSFPFSREKLEQLFTASKTTPQSLKDMAMQQCQGWHSVLTSMIQNSPDSQITGHPVYDVEPKEFSTLRGNCLESHINFDEDCHFHEKSPVTLLGDAFHPMSPFKGQGANQALLDAQCLASHLGARNQQSEVYGKRSMWEVFADYEKNVIPRATKKVMKSRKAAEVLHSPIALTPGNISRASVAQKAI